MLLKMFIFIVYVLNELVILKVLYRNALHSSVRLREKNVFFIIILGKTTHEEAT